MKLLGLLTPPLSPWQLVVRDLIEAQLGLILSLDWLDTSLLEPSEPEQQRLLRRAAGFIVLTASSVVLDLPDKPLLILGEEVTTLATERTQPCWHLAQLDLDEKGQLTDRTYSALTDLLQLFIREAADFNAAQGKSDRFPSFRTGLREVDLVSGASDEWR